MCVICVLWDKGNITKQEAEQALREFAITADKSELEHVIEVSEKIQGEEK